MRRNKLAQSFRVVVSMMAGGDSVVSSRVNLVSQRSCIAALTLSVLLLSAGSVNAANNWYVVPGGAGNGGGTAWTNASDANWVSGNAWDRVGAGDTIWVAGGTYANMPTLINSGSSGNPIYIKRVLSSDSVPVASPGWNPSFDSQVKWAAIYIPNTSYVTVDGRVSNGIQVQPSMFSIKMSYNGNCDHLQFLNLEVLGSHDTSAGYGVYCAGTASNLEFSNLWIHGMAEGFAVSSWNNVIIEHCLLSDYVTIGISHVDVAYFYTCTNVTMRYNTISNSPADGVYFNGGYGVDLFYFYGNVVCNSYGNMVGPSEPTNYNGRAYVFNNIFYSPSAVYFGSVGFNNVTFQCYNNVFYNTIFYQSTTNVSFDGFNAYNNWNYSGCNEPTNEPGSTFSLTTNAFVNAAGGNFQLSAGSMLIGRGTNLAALFPAVSADMAGNTFPASGAGAWDIGAYEHPNTNNSGVSTFPSIVNFSSVKTNAVATMIVMVTNNSSATFIGTASFAITNSSNSFQIGAGAPYNLSANQHQYMQVSFSPSTLGPATNSIIFTRSSGGVLGSLPVSGTGVTNSSSAASPPPPQNLHTNALGSE